MSEYFHVKARFLRQMDNGLTKQAKEEYLVDAMSFTEAESRVTEECKAYKELTLDAIARSHIKEVVMYGDTDLWFKCRVEYCLMDDESEKESRVVTYLLINANDSKEAYERCQDHLKEMLVPFEIPKVERTKIVEIYDHKSTRIPKPVSDKADDLKNESGRQPVGFVNKGITTALDASARGEGIVDMGCAYSKSDQVGKKRKHQRLQDDGHGHPIIELPLVKPTDPTHGQAVTFEVTENELRDMVPEFDESDFDTDESVAQEMAESSKFYPDELKTGYNSNRPPLDD